jgi:hypothetical protein
MALLHWALLVALLALGGCGLSSDPCGGDARCRLAVEQSLKELDYAGIPREAVQGITVEPVNHCGNLPQDQRDATGRVVFQCPDDLLYALDVTIIFRPGSGVRGPVAVTAAEFRGVPLAVWSVSGLPASE